ncbi:MAG: ABC transporter permease [Pseudomonadota bacterium]|nr:ABC transporter permease [Pseudomonadota bacterium]
MELQELKYLKHPEIAYKVGVGRSRFSLASEDVTSGLKSYKVWALLGWQDIKQRYRRSVLGPLWLTISTGIMIGMLGALYGQLFRMPLEVYLPFLATGIVIWALIASLLNESCSVFIAADSMIKQVRVPLTLHVCRMVCRNVIIFIHNLIVLVPVFFFYGKEIDLTNLLLVPIAIGLIALNGVWAGLILGTFCTRFRDIPPTVTNLVQVIFFVTPIMWLPEIIKGRSAAWLVEANPLYHFIELFRAPFLGAQASVTSWIIVLSITLIGMVAAILTLWRFRHRVAYWL